eukprot:9483107-Alexandrium_andersonii.AAC.1
MVKLNFRDLGAHISLGATAVSPTGAKRLEAAAEVARAAGQLKAPHQRKLACIAGKVMPGGLYGCQAGPVPQKQLRKLGSAVAQAIYPGAAAGRARALAQSVAARGTIDPQIVMLVMRAVAVRRQRAKSG